MSLACENSQLTAVTVLSGSEVKSKKNTPDVKNKLRILFSFVHEMPCRFLQTLSYHQ